MEWETRGSLPHTRKQAATTRRLSFLIYRYDNIQGSSKHRSKAGPAPITRWTSNRRSYPEMSRSESKGAGQTQHSVDQNRCPLSGDSPVGFRTEQTWVPRPSLLARHMPWEIALLPHSSSRKCPWFVCLFLP